MFGKQNFRIIPCYLYFLHHCSLEEDKCYNASFLIVYLERTSPCSFLRCVSNRKRQQLSFAVFLNCCLYIHILNSSFNASYNNFLTFISFSFYNIYDIISSKKKRENILKYQSFIALFLLLLFLHLPFCENKSPYLDNKKEGSRFFNLTFSLI